MRLPRLPETGSARFKRWPLLMAAALTFGFGVGLDLSSRSTSSYIATGFFSLGAAAFGAFLYAEGIRHREWSVESFDDDKPIDEE
jgi:hypothetical protein